MKIVKRYCGETLLQMQVFTGNRKVEIDWNEGNFSKVSFSSKTGGAWQQHVAISFTKINEKKGFLSCERDDSVRFVDARDFFSFLCLVEDHPFGNDKQFQQNVDCEVATEIGVKANEGGVRKSIFLWTCKCDPNNGQSVYVDDWKTTLSIYVDGELSDCGEEDVEIVKEYVDSSSPKTLSPKEAPVLENETVEEAVDELDITIPSAMDTKQKCITVSADDASVGKETVSQPKYALKKDVRNIFCQNWKIKGY